MSTYPPYTVQSQDVSKFTIKPLEPLPLHMPGAIQSRDLWRVLVCAAASHLAVHQACDQLERAPSGPTGLGTLAEQLGDLEALAGHVHDLLARLLPKGLGTRGRRGAMDVIALPSHGTVAAPQQDAVGRRKAQCGTPQFFTAATAAAVSRGRRSPLASCRVRAKQTMAHVVRPLLARVVTWGLRLQLLVLDRGFDRVRVMRELLTGEVPGILPAVHRGQKPPAPGGPTGPSALATEKTGRWTS